MVGLIRFVADNKQGRLFYWVTLAGIGCYTRLACMNAWVSSIVLLLIFLSLLVTLHLNRLLAISFVGLQCCLIC
jgi:hypothetical protein